MIGSLGDHSGEWMTWVPTKVKLVTWQIIIILVHFLISVSLLSPPADTHLHAMNVTLTHTHPSPCTYTQHNTIQYNGLSLEMNGGDSLSLYFLSLSFSFYLPTYLSVCLSVCLSVYLSICLSVCLSVQTHKQEDKAFLPFVWKIHDKWNPSIQL